MENEILQDSPKNKNKKSSSLTLPLNSVFGLIYFTVLFGKDLAYI